MRCRKKKLAIVAILGVVFLFALDSVPDWGRYVKDIGILKKIYTYDVPRSLHAQAFALPFALGSLGSPLEKANNATQRTSKLVLTPASTKTVPEGTQTNNNTISEDDPFLHRMEEVQKRRHDLIRQKCHDLYNLTLVNFKKDRDKILSWKTLYEHAYANDDFEFIICRVLKVGSFSWRKVIKSLYDKGSPQFRKKQQMGDYSIREYNDEQFLHDLQNYTKILFVREPFARLLSGYRDKYVELRHFPYYRPIGSKIIKTLRKGATRVEIASGKPTFEEFIRWLVRNPDDRDGDYHWRPLFDWYHPCEIHYDYIGKLETAADDAKYIFKKIGIDKLESYPSTEIHHTFSSAQDVLQKYYSNISPELLPKIVHRYREEFELFNYSVPQTMSDVWTITRA